MMDCTLRGNITYFTCNQCEVTFAMEQVIVQGVPVSEWRETEQCQVLNRLKNGLTWEEHIGAHDDKYNYIDGKKGKDSV